MNSQVNQASKSVKPQFNETAAGVYLITVTPFKPDGALDLESTDRLIDFYLEAGANGLTLLGVLGEAPKLTAQESADYVKRVLARVKGKVPWWLALRQQVLLRWASSPSASWIWAPMA